MRTHDNGLAAVAYAPCEIKAEIEGNPVQIEILHHLGVDFRHASAPYKGPPLHEDKGDIKVTELGFQRRWVEHESGGYWE